MQHTANIASIIIIINVERHKNAIRKRQRLYYNTALR